MVWIKMIFWLRKAIESHRLIWVGTDDPTPCVAFYLVRPHKYQKKVLYGDKIEVLK